ncbi:MAG: efflux RND transporter permease subunit [Chromatiales bacterium]|nr:efflux RND transporter permease subunit [Chromatiales bacterium]
MIRWFAHHQTASNLLMAAIAILGLVSVSALQRETFPRLESDRVEVRIVYPGATSEDVEDALCRRLEDAIETVTHLREIRCEAREAIAIATARMDEGEDIVRFLDDIKTEVDAIDDFPSGIEQPVVAELGRTDQVISVAVTGLDDPVALKAYAEDLKARMRTLGTIADITVRGFSDHQLRVELSAARLRQFGLSVSDIGNAIARNSVTAPVGQIDGATEEILLRFDDQRKTTQALRDLVVISGSAGGAIRLGDIATIVDQFEDDNTKILFDGRRAALLDISKTPRQDVLDVYQEVKQFIAAERVRAPPGLTLELTQDRASVVQDRLDMLVTNGAQGLVLVFLVLWLFFSFRYSFWVTMGLPVSFLGALVVLPMLGITVNMISMVGLLIGIGLLMDDAIVIAENVAARLARGEKPLAAATNGVVEVLPGVLSSFATTVLVFGSLAFITGEIGQVLRVLPVVLILVLSVSLAEAFLILPNHLGHSLAHQRPAGATGFRAAFERAFDRLRERGVGRVLDAAIEYRYLTLGIVLMLAVLAVAMPASGKLKFVGFPEIEGDLLEARVLLPQGTPLARTEALVRHIEQAARTAQAEFDPLQPDRRPLVQHITVIFGENPDAYETGPHVARVLVDLLSTEIRATRLADFAAHWRDEIGSPPDVIALNVTEPTIGPGGRAIDLRLSGGDLETLKRAALDLQEWIGSFRGVVNLSDDLRPGKPEIRLRLKPDAGVLGVTAASVSEQVRAAFQGITVDEFPNGAETYEVDVRLSAADRSNPGALAALTIAGPGGARIPLPVVVSLEPARGWARIQRVDGQRTVSVQGEVEADIANAQELLNLAKREVFDSLRERYPGLEIGIEGQSAESAQTGKSMARNVLLGLLGVYMLLALQFRGYLAPITVMLVIPTSLIGVVFGHLLMGLDMTMPSMVGMASLFGVVVNDSILLVVFIRQARIAGATVVDAAKRAGRDRFRPILLTSITTIAGLMPLLLERSTQAQILIPLAVSLAFGLLVATVTALFLVPALYCILDDFNALGALDEEPDSGLGTDEADKLPAHA